MRDKINEMNVVSDYLPVDLYIVQQYTIYN